MWKTIQDLTIFLAQIYQTKCSNTRRSSVRNMHMVTFQKLSTTGSIKLVKRAIKSIRREHQSSLQEHNRKNEEFRLKKKGPATVRGTVGGVTGTGSDNDSS